MAQGGVVPVVVGSWMSSMFLLPVGLIITYRANRDKGISFAFFVNEFVSNVSSVLSSFRDQMWPQKS